MLRRLRYRPDAPSSIAPLAVFRAVFGGVMLFAVLRFWLLGWIEAQYAQPDFFFKYYGFEWVTVPDGWLLYGLYALMGLGALGICLGAFYRLSALLFFLSFTYSELMDVTNYLNHYYFVSLVAFILIWLPANRRWSVDVWRRPHWHRSEVPRWTVDVLKLQLGLVYLYAGLAKINPDWVLDAQPLMLWLRMRSHYPVIGPWLDERWVAYAFAWFGLVYDLSIPFWMSWRPSRPIAYVFVIVFHVMTWLLFPIGMFPWVMIGATLIFFSPKWHEQWVRRFRRLLRLRPAVPAPKVLRFSAPVNNLLKLVFVLFLAWQIIWPWRFLAYPGKLFWHEQGYRFSWRVMLIEKVGTVRFLWHDDQSGRQRELDYRPYLRPTQEKMMSTQPDLILQMAHHLADSLREEEGIAEPVITVDAHAVLNGEGSRRFIDPRVNLAAQPRGFAPKTWILPYELDHPRRQSLAKTEN